MTVYCKNNKWYCKFNADGRPYHRACKGAKSRKEALQYKDVLRAKIQLGDTDLLKKDSKITLAEMVEKYLEYSETNKASYPHDKTYSKNWLKHFGNKRISLIKPLDVEGYKTFRLNQGISPSTINRERASLSKMFSIAVQNEYIKSNPCSSVKKLRVDNQKIRFLTKEEEGRLFKVLKEHWIRPIIITALQTGMRKGEILNLQWSCVNLENRYIDVLKTKSGKARQVPISDKLYDVLINQPKISDYIFVNPITKKKHSDGSIHDVFTSFIKQAEIDNFTFHCLRHTVATRMVAENIDFVTVMNILGHSNMQTTKRYAHPVSENKRKAIDALNNF